MKTNSLAMNLERFAVNDCGDADDGAGQCEDQSLLARNVLSQLLDRTAKVVA